MSETNNETPVSLTEAINAHRIGLSAVAAGKVLLVAGVTAVAWRMSSKAGRPAKAYKIATAFGEKLGAVNEKASVPTGDPTNLKFSPSKFAALWASHAVQDALADLIEAGDVKLREPAQSEIF
ncbi:hypothetical protein PQR39_35250 [Paraburkholderia sediminicola]|uniref:hypothetical protein n=1 Tax=Paraburkholderia sediminicola TaxID=458836 RepID=UPI0038BB8233